MRLLSRFQPEYGDLVQFSMSIPRKDPLVKLVGLDKPRFWYKHDHQSDIRKFSLYRVFGALRELGLPDTITELKWLRRLLKRLEAQIQTSVGY